MCSTSPVLALAKLITLNNNRRLASLGLSFNLLAFIACAFAIQLSITKPDQLHITTFVVALAGWLPALIIGTIACWALLLRRRWGIVLALVALGLQLLTVVPYGIVRTVLLPGNRILCGSLSGLFLSVGVVLIIYWSLALRHE